MVHNNRILFVSARATQTVMNEQFLAFAYFCGAVKYPVGCDLIKDQEEYLDKINTLGN